MPTLPSVRLKFQLSVQSEQGPNGSSLKVREFHPLKSNQKTDPLFLPPHPSPHSQGSSHCQGLPQRCGPHHH